MFNATQDSNLFSCIFRMGLTHTCTHPLTHACTDSPAPAHPTTHTPKHVLSVKAALSYCMAPLSGLLGGVFASSPPAMHTYPRARMR